MNNPIQKNGFTLTEILIVVIIIGLITGFALPNFNKSMEVSYEQDAVGQLKTIHGAQLLYRMRHTANSFWNPAPTADLTSTTGINQILHLNIIANGFTYTCLNTTDPTKYSCQAQRTSGAYTILINETGTPRCSAGVCPSCTSANCD